MVRWSTFAFRLALVGGAAAALLGCGLRTPPRPVPTVGVIERLERGRSEEPGAEVARPPSVTLASFGANRLVMADRFNLPVVPYDDCTSASEITHSGAALDSCIGPAKYFVGHNPGPFAPLLQAREGDVIEYGDAQGVLHRYRVVGLRTWNRWDGPPPLLRPEVAAEFQTCVTLDGDWDRILDAVEDPVSPAPAGPS